MDDALTKYHVWLFINRTQVGDNHTFADWYADDAAANADARAYVTAEGYAIDSIEVSEREIRPASSLACPDREGDDRPPEKWRGKRCDNPSPVKRLFQAIRFLRIAA